MQFSASTAELLGALDALSHGKLSRRQGLGTLIELATRGNRTAVLDEISFLAKFVSRTYGIMARIGPDGNGYERLQREFAVNLKKIGDLLSALLADAPGSLHAAFAQEYLARTPHSLQNLLALCYDLSWYKNWLIER